MNESLNYGNYDLVGSSTGAVTRRQLLGCIRRFHLRARLGFAVAPFPAPATSHAACGFPALRAPAHFASRVMRPIEGKPLYRVAENGPPGTPPLPVEDSAKSAKTIQPSP